VSPAVLADKLLDPNANRVSVFRVLDAVRRRVEAGIEPA